MFLHVEPTETVLELKAKIQLATDGDDCPGGFPPRTQKLLVGGWAGRIARKPPSHMRRKKRRGRTIRVVAIARAQWCAETRVDLEVAARTGGLSHCVGLGSRHRAHAGKRVGLGWELRRQTSEPW